MYVELKNINKRYGNYHASKEVSIDIQKGHLIGLLGPSGSGKTTILRMIAGLETPDSGDIYINGVRVNDLSPGKRGIGFVFQSYALFRYMTVFDNIAFGLLVEKRKKSEIKARVMELVKLIGLEGLENRYPGQLSGGQRQRVAFARALAPGPSLLLLDEPFAAIDAKVRQELRIWLKEMIHKLQVTSIFVTHDQQEAIEVADEIIITNNGCIEQKGTPIEIYNHPKSAFVAQFMGESTVLSNIHSLIGFEHVADHTKAVIRPEFIRVTKKNSTSTHVSACEMGIIKETYFRGSYLELRIEVKNMLFTANVSLEKSFALGEEVQILIYRLYIFADIKAIIIENTAMEDNSWVMI